MYFVIFLVSVDDLLFVDLEFAWILILKRLQQTSDAFF